MLCLMWNRCATNLLQILRETSMVFPIARVTFFLSKFRRTCVHFSEEVQDSADIQGKGRGRELKGKIWLNCAGSSKPSDDPLPLSSFGVLVFTQSCHQVSIELVKSIVSVHIGTLLLIDIPTPTEIISIVNQAVSVVVAACRGVDVTPEKLHRKYAEIYMALDIVLKGVSSIRLAAMLASMHGDSIAKMVHSAIDTENKIRGGDNWTNVEYISVEHQINVDVFSKATFELPPETLAAGDEVAATIDPLHGSSAEKDDQLHTITEESPSQKDPFAASDAVNKPEELVGGFNKDKDSLPADVTSALAGLEITTLPPAAATQPTTIGVEGFEGEYGGIEFSKEDTTLREAFEGFDDAFGGGLDASEFLQPSKPPKLQQGLGGLEALQSGQSEAPTSAASPGDKLENILVKKTEMKGPEMYISEEISAEFRESLLARVGLMGVVYLKTLPPKTAGDKETEFSFRVDGTAGVKRFIMQSTRVSSLGNGLFHVRTTPSEDPLPILKYSLLPRLTPLPLRVRLIKRHSGTLLSLMIQYASNPELPAPLNDVTFVLKLPVDPTLLKVSPKAVLNRSEKELRWHVTEIPLKGPLGKLRARMPVDSDEQDSGEEIEVVGLVQFSVQGTRSLSGVSLRPATEGKTDFYEVNHRFSNGTYLCN
ncbi:hypothetical protein Sjap_018952 [Stephania japonica]|uniref:MHD domain-containing protein n=1 Tax=Stephania japonica TaxID=461633 RepID=A0AAP0HU98_9MAGN